MDWIFKPRNFFHRCESIQNEKRKSQKKELKNDGTKKLDSQSSTNAVTQQKKNGLVVNFCLPNGYVAIAED